MKFLSQKSRPDTFTTSTNIGNIKYSDGGLPIIGDNSPVLPVYLRGCETIFVIHVHPKGKTDKKRFSRSEIIDIAPRPITGSTLKFDGELSKKMIELGYEDAKRIIHRGPVSRGCYGVVNNKISV